MRILFLAAVDFELDVARRLRTASDDLFCCSGIGPEATRRALGQALASASCDLVVGLGVAGVYGSRFPLGTVVQVVSERYGGCSDEVLCNPAPSPLLASLPQAAGNTVPALEDRYRTVEADVESMEGAALFETCLRHAVPFAEIRAVSNVVGEADRARWDIPLALRRLESTLRPLFP